MIAHELGHITGGHLTRRDQAMAGARGIAAIGMLGAAAAVVGGVPEASVAIAAGAGQAAHRSALAHSRAEEAAADQAGLRYLAAAGGDPRAVLTVLERFRAPGGADRPLRRPLRPEPPDVVRPHRDARGAGGGAAARRPAVGRGRLLARAHGGEARRLHRQPGARRCAAIPRPTPPTAAALARAIAWHRRPDPARADAAMRRAHRGAAGRRLPLRPRRRSSGSRPATPPARRSSGGRRWRWRRASR